ncbi:MAG: ATP-binding response regulator [Hyphomicrobiaceae bacterium]
MAAAPKVLVIDDDTTLQVLAKEYLTAAGYAAKVAEDGAKGRRFAENFAPDIILLDVVMPGCDGYEICAELKRQPRTANIPIVLMTGSREPDVIKRGLKAGATDFITKPVDWEFLGDRVRHVLDQETSRNSAAPPVSDQTRAASDSSVAQRNAEYQRENSELKHQLLAAGERIDELKAELASSASANSRQSEPSVSELHAQISEIEQEWSNRLQQAVSVANKRADQRIARLQADLDEKCDQLQSLNEELERTRTDAVAEKDDRVRELRRELEGAKQLELQTLSRSQEQKITELVRAHEINTREIWKFVSRTTSEYRASLRRSQATAGEVQRHLVDGSNSENVLACLDTLSTSMVNSLRSVSKLSDWALFAGRDASETEHRVLELGSLIEECVRDVRVKLDRADIAFANAVEKGVEIAAEEPQLKRAFSHLVEFVTRYAPPNGAVDINADCDDSGGLTLRFANSGAGSTRGLNADPVVCAEHDAFPQTGDSHELDLWIAKAILADFGGTVSVADVANIGPAISVWFAKPTASDQAPQQSEQMGMSVAV